ncbi:choice-of-anchor J domain-containing protein [Flavobacterium sp.]|uniref:T9SS-dependent choice-of-anchor J family protein n=2 Tax=Flavobacterium TaxID=237 RepID=UPI0025B9063F|nr:choice-of-anchor J domain-containing protein [Flavobacterium sp.]
MKKTLLFILLPFLGISQQNVFNFGFDGTNTAMQTAGWQFTNQSSPLGASTWSVATYTTPLSSALFGSGNVNTVPVGQAGGNNSFALVNFNSTTGAGTISNWLITPTITVQNGDIVTFYTRKGTDGTTDYPDRLELRMSSAGTHVVPSTGSSDVGTFTTLCTSVNPTLAAGFVYPKTWTQYTYTVSGLSGSTAVRFAFRYFITNGGPNGANSDLIGVDTFSVDRPLSTDSFFNQNFAMYPNPASNVLNLLPRNGNSVNHFSITDLNGRTVASGAVVDNSVNVSNLSPGVYFVSVETNEGKGTAKFVKN